MLKLPLCCRGGRGSLYSQLFLFKENDILQVEICQLLKSFVLDRDVIDRVLLNLISATIGSFLHTLVDPLGRIMNLNVRLPAIATFVDHTAVNKKRTDKQSSYA